ncbi:hypothetical protein [Jeongeupia sp. HS-3]|uniref:hypothetical protein n=1 Tax=Jeongeupia sp. HS-3 TaxID=1009682 RepID=UPI001910E002|nr:hypothetical protein [Jeongeupia sp. HS-3]
MIIVLAMMGLYKSTLQTTVLSKIGASQDGARTAGFLSVQSSLQSAGFGLNTFVETTDFRLYTDAADDSISAPTAATLSTTVATGNALFWRWVDASAAVNTCALLYAPTGGGLKYFSKTGCTSPSGIWGATGIDLASASHWLVPPNVDPGKTAPAGVVPNAVTISVNKTSAAGCVPFGIAATVPAGATETTTARFVVKLSMLSSNAGTTGDTQFAQPSSTCLANIHLAPTP